MIERWIEAGKKNYGAWHQQIYRRLAAASPRSWGLAVMVLAVFLAAIHPVLAYFHNVSQQSKLDAIADEVGSISYMFYRNGETFAVRDAFGIHADTPQINHAGNKVLYCHTSDNGGAAYLNDLLTGERSMVYEEMASNFFNGPSTDLEIHSWSPDDAKFIYSRTGKNIVIAEGAAGRDLAVMHISYTSDLAWLDAKSFVCADSHDGWLTVVRRQEDRTWAIVDKPIHAGHAGDNFAGFTALSPDRVTWQESNTIVSFNLATHETNVVVKVVDKTLKAFSYSPKTGQFLLTCTVSNQDSLWRLDNDAQANQTLAQLISTNSIRSAKLINDGHGFAYIDENNLLLIQTNATARPLVLFEHGKADSFSVSADRQRVAVAAVASNEPTFGIWQYDVAANSVRPVIAAAEHGLADVVPVTPQLRIITGPKNHQLYLNIFQPAHFDRHKKYPLVIANTPYGAAQPYMKQYSMAAANAGAYFVILDRGSWFDANGFGDAWSENLPTVIDYISKDPTIDRKKVYLVSNCMESNFLKDYAAKFPGTVTGAIMLIANDVPDPANFASGKYQPKLLISTCDAWEGKGERMQKYQTTAAQSGVEMNYVIHPNTKHDFVEQGFPTRPHPRDAPPRVRQLKTHDEFRKHKSW